MVKEDGFVVAARKQPKARAIVYCQLCRTPCPATRIMRGYNPACDDGHAHCLTCRENGVTAARCRYSKGAAQAAIAALGAKEVVGVHNYPSKGGGGRTNGKPKGAPKAGAKADAKTDARVAALEKELAAVRAQVGKQQSNGTQPVGQEEAAVPDSSTEMDGKISKAKNKIQWLQNLQPEHKDSFDMQGGHEAVLAGWKKSLAEWEAEKRGAEPLATQLSKAKRYEASRVTVSERLAGKRQAAFVALGEAQAALALCDEALASAVKSHEEAVEKTRILTAQVAREMVGTSGQPVQAPPARPSRMLDDPRAHGLLVALCRVAEPAQVLQHCGGNQEMATEMASFATLLAEDMAKTASVATSTAVPAVPTDDMQVDLEEVAHSEAEAFVAGLDENATTEQKTARQTKVKQMADYTMRVAKKLKVKA